MVRTRGLVGLSCGLALLSVMSTGFAQDIRSQDQLAMLYAPQLNFTREGDPIIRVGIVEGRDTVEFTPDRPIRVLPSGESGAQIELPAGVKYTVSVSDSTPGAYRHSVVVHRLPVAERKAADAVVQTWTQRGYLPEVFEVGGLFAVQGKVFDSRTVLVGLGGTKSRDEAQKIKSGLETKFGVEASIHSEITRPPGAAIHLEGAGLKVKISTRDVLTIAPLRGEENKIVYTVPDIQKSYGAGFETRRYTGSLIFAPDYNGKLVGMVSLGAERLLKGVVPAEMYASAPDAALRAQAVAARNNIFSAIGVRNLADPFMLRGDVMDQVYGGVGVENPRTSKAVDATRGRVMFHGQKIIEAVYSSNAGGFTESNENVWDMEPRPWLRGKIDVIGAAPAAFKNGVKPNEVAAFLDANFESPSKKASVSSSKLFRWDRVVTVDKAEAWLKENRRSVGRIKDFQVLSRGVSGRVMRLKVVGDKGETVVERELNVRRLFGGLRSGLFVMDVQKGRSGFVEQVEFRGAGFGHGVGMCQTGAIGLAESGVDYQDILKRYYSGISLESLY